MRKFLVFVFLITAVFGISMASVSAEEEKVAYLFNWDKFYDAGEGMLEIYLINEQGEFVSVSTGADITINGTVYDCDGITSSNGILKTDILVQYSTDSSGIVTEINFSSEDPEKIEGIQKGDMRINKELPLFYKVDDLIRPSHYAEGYTYTAKIYDYAVIISDMKCTSTQATVLYYYMRMFEGFDSKEVMLGVVFDKEVNGQITFQVDGDTYYADDSWEGFDITFTLPNEDGMHSISFGVPGVSDTRQITYETMRTETYIRYFSQYEYRSSKMEVFDCSGNSETLNFNYMFYLNGEVYYDDEISESTFDGAVIIKYVKNSDGRIDSIAFSTSPNHLVDVEKDDPRIAGLPVFYKRGSYIRPALFETGYLYALDIYEGGILITGMRSKTAEVTIIDYEVSEINFCGVKTLGIHVWYSDDLYHGQLAGTIKAYNQRTLFATGGSGSGGTLLPGYIEFSNLPNENREYIIEFGIPGVSDTRTIMAETKYSEDLVEKHMLGFYEKAGVGGTTIYIKFSFGDNSVRELALASGIYINDVFYNYYAQSAEVLGILGDINGFYYSTNSDNIVTRIYFTYEEIWNITSVTHEGGNVNISFSYNLSQYMSNPDIILAVYSSDGMLIGTIRKSVEESENGAISFDISAIPDAYRVKAFLWSSVGNIKAVSKCRGLEI